MESITKQLVKAGHELSVQLGNRLGMNDTASLVQRLTAQLDITAAALREMTKDRDAEHADVLAWEKTMFKACGEDGYKSVAEKFAEMEAKCAALAAEKEKFAVECAATKIAIAYLKSGRHDFTLNTQATDDFLAEVRAHDLNAFIRHHSAELDAHIKNGGEQFDEKSVRIRDIIVSARLFREQIRKEAAQ